jgi:hypothetical protein
VELSCGVGDIYICIDWYIYICMCMYIYIYIIAHRHTHATLCVPLCCRPASLSFSLISNGDVARLFISFSIVLFIFHCQFSIICAPANVYCMCFFFRAHCSWRFSFSLVPHGDFIFLVLFIFHCQLSIICASVIVLLYVVFCFEHIAHEMILLLFCNYSLYLGHCVLYWLRCIARHGYQLCPPSI